MLESCCKARACSPKEGCLRCGVVGGPTSYDARRTQKGRAQAHGSTAAKWVTLVRSLSRQHGSAVVQGSKDVLAVRHLASCSYICAYPARAVSFLVRLDVAVTLSVSRPLSLLSFSLCLCVFLAPFRFSASLGAFSDAVCASLPRSTCISELRVRADLSASSIAQHCRPFSSSRASCNIF